MLECFIPVEADDVGTVKYVRLSSRDEKKYPGALKTDNEIQQHAKFLLGLSILSAAEKNYVIPEEDQQAILYRLEKDLKREAIGHYEPLMGRNG